MKVDTISIEHVCQCCSPRSYEIVSSTFIYVFVWSDRRYAERIGTTRMDQDLHMLAHPWLIHMYLLTESKSSLPSQILSGHATTTSLTSY
jgi:hypothetical protein